MGYFSISFSDLHDLLMLLVKKMFYYVILFRSQTSIGYSISRLFKHASIVEFGSVIFAVSLYKRGWSWYGRLARFFRCPFVLLRWGIVYSRNNKAVITFSEINVDFNYHAFGRRSVIELSVSVSEILFHFRFWLWVLTVGSVHWIRSLLLWPISLKLNSLNFN